MKKGTKVENTRKVVSIGTSVEFGEPDQILLRGKINAINLYKLSTTYEVMFWFGPEFKSITLREEDFKILGKNKDKIEIGFKNE